MILPDDDRTRLDNTIPRTRGDDPAIAAQHNIAPDYSPHTRG